MTADDADTLIDYNEPIQQPKELLRKRREQFMRFRRAARPFLALILVVTIAASVVAWIDGWWAAQWCALAIAVAIAFLMLALEHVQFCGECDAQRSLNWTKPPWCANCRRLLDPSRVLFHAPGMIDLDDERYLNNDEPVVKLIAMVLLLGIKDRASEIRFEPGAEQYRLSYRCGGEVFEMAPPPLYLHRAISSTLKAMAGLSSERTAQGGNIQIMLEGATIAARVESDMCEFGENVVMFFSEMNGKS